MTENFRKYCLTHTGRELQDKHLMTESGIWHVVSEPTENNNGRSLGYFEGTLYDVLMHVTNLNNFWGYGAGGTVELVTPIHIDAKTMAKAKELREHLSTLKDDVTKTQKELKNLGVI